MAEEPKCNICGSTENLHQCVDCRRWFCEDHIEFSPDPYAEEINGDNTPVWECKEDRQNRRDEI